MSTQAGRSSTPLPPNVKTVNFTELTGIQAVTTSGAVPADIVGTIASEALSTEIARYYLTVPIYPDSLVSTIDKYRPSYIVIERAALYQGTWFGAESESGGRLIDEILRVEKWAKKHRRILIYVDDKGPDTPYSRQIRDSSTVCFPSEAFWSELPEQPHRRKIYHLVSDYSNRTGN